ncbi:MAG: tRNA uridine-5-carboxymethylaminomethyl(34) synthesis GTPase MnmE [Candidatus Eisenbacteria bacterium]|nr:tRNA uridine-5-carboxymethylaminomethyl(34) synthesis GTPase MnmE [Candidatus Eisenbacteria bacterium]
MASDTIAAISTAPGRGAIAVVRLSGPESVEIVDNLFRGKETLARTRSHSVRHGRLIDRGGRPLDDVLITVMRAPDTYTGEDVVEINCHGGMLVSQLVLQALVEAGCRLAEPGEFTRRAFLNDRIDLAQAEAVAEIVAAKTRKAAERALRQLEGGLSERIRAVKTSVVGVLAELEARIDFPEDVTESLELDVLCATLNECARSLEEIVSERASHTLLSEGVRIPIVGKSNVGKSSLFNAIVGRPRVIVSSLPGTTRDTVEEEIELEGVPVRLVDTAGLRSASEVIEEEGVRRTMEELRLADLVILVVDASAGPNVPCAYSDDVEILTLIGETPCLIVVNKIDLASPAAAHSALEAHAREARSRLASPSETSPRIQRSEVVDVSAIEGTGISRLRDTLASRLTATGVDFSDAACASQRHVDLLRSAMENIQRARRALEPETSDELVAFELREAAQELGSITGERIGPDILDSIFSRFCVGK